MDFWGTVMPAWIGAVGGVISAVVGAVALVSSLRTRGSVRQLRDGVNAESPSATVSGGPAQLTGEGTITAEGVPHFQGEASASVTAEASGEGAATMPAALHVAVVWSAEKDGSRYLLFNRSSTHSARVVALGPVREGNGVRSLVPLPVNVPAEASVPFAIDRRFTGPSVTGVMITWEEDDRPTQTNVLYV